MFSCAFTATTFRRFWYYWNPLYGYVLAYFCYAPLRRIAGKEISFVATFALSGFLLHDFPVFIILNLAKLPFPFPFPFVTVMFVAVALIVRLSEFVGVTLRDVPKFLRVVSHLAVISGAFSVSLAMSFYFYKF